MTRPPRELGVAVFLFLLYLNVPTVASEFHGVPQSVAQLVVLLLVLPFVGSVALRREPVVMTGTHAWVLAYGVAVLLSAAVAFAPRDTTEAVKTFALEGLLLFLLVTNTVRTVDGVRRAMWALVAAASVMGAISLFQQATQAFDSDFGGFAQITTRGIRVAGDTFQPRLAGPLGEKNRYAQVLLVTMPLAVVLARGTRSRAARWLALAGAGLACAGIVLTFSRGTAVAAVGVVVLLVLLRQVGPRQVLLAGALFVAGVSAVAPQFLERVGSVAAVDEVGDTGGEADGALVGRATANLAAWRVFVDHPLLGVGPERFYTDYSQSVGNEVGLRYFETPRRAHNLYLEIAADLGVVGLSAFLGLTVGTILALDRLRRRSGGRADLAGIAAGFEAAIAAYLLSGLFLHLAFQRYFWLLMALAASAVWAIGRELTFEVKDRRPDLAAAAA